MTGSASDTFSWTSLEGESKEGACRETVDFAEILEATKTVRPTETSTRGHPNLGTTRDVLTDGDVDAFDGILAQGRLEDAKWVDWSDFKREFQRQD